MRTPFRLGAAALIASVAVVAGGAATAASAPPVHTPDRSAASSSSKGDAAPPTKRDAAPPSKSDAAPPTKRDAAQAIKSWRDLGDAFESSQLLDGAARVSALQSLDGSVARALHGDMGDLDDEQKLAARFLAARLDFERGDYTHAVSGFSAAADAATRSRFADDAEFASIEALEAAGHDAEASKDWLQWEKRFPTSPLLPAARLARAWNALRRGETGEADALLQGIDTDSPWLVKDDRFVLARAIASLQMGQVAEALGTLGDRPRSAPALYLRALALARTGRALQAAAAWQEVADRWPGGPLADAARFAKANTFLAARDYRSAASEMARVASQASDPAIRAEAELRSAGAVFMSGAPDSALTLLRVVAARHRDTDVAARAQFLIGEALVARGRFEPAIAEYNQVLTRYFQHKVAASAQYRVARCLDALGRRSDATGSYQAVVSGYPLEPEALPAAYLAGVGLVQRGAFRAAVPYFQIVLDRYARAANDSAAAFAAPEQRELVEASLCMLEWSWHQAGDMGQVAGAPHLLLQKLPASRSAWRAWALLIDADATAALGRYAEAQSALETVAAQYPDQPVAAPATQLLAWTYAREDRDSLAIATEERLLARWGSSADEAIVSTALLDIAHARFNQKKYKEAAGTYETFLGRWPRHRDRATALYQAGLCYLRLGRAGDAVDRWETLVKDSASSALAERAWARAGDVYFQADRFDDARRCYTGLLEHFGASSAAGLASLRLAQCDYNAGRDAAALEAFSRTVEHYPSTPYATEAKRGTELALYRIAASANGDSVLARLLEQYPTSAFAADALLQIGKRHYQAKRWSEAAEDFRQIVSRFPASASADQAQFLMADALEKAGASDDAKLAYEQFLGYFPQSELRSTVSFRLGALRFASKEYMQAAVAFTTALEDSAPPEVSGPARYNLALCERQLGEVEQARADLERYTREFPAGALVAQAAFQLADLDEAAGQLALAQTGFAGVLEHSPGPALQAEAAFRLGRCREQLQDVPGAMRAYAVARSCTDLDQPYRLSALARLAALHESRREYTRAVEAYRDIIHHSKDRELIAAAEDRVSQLSPHSH